MANLRTLVADDHAEARERSAASQSDESSLDADGRRVTYRPDIDGLRAVAILAVVGYHAGPAFVPGGFVGVDVFFVISGFLISSIILSDLSAGDFSFARFYARRARRILPALLVVLIGSGLIGWLVLVGGEFRDLQRHVAAAATFVTNVLLWREAGYFDASAQFKPLQHLWSLAVEEQFYLLWPSLLYVAWRRRLNVASFIAAILALSFLCNLTLTGRNGGTAAFFLPQARLWELLVGALLAYFEVHHRDGVRRFARRAVYRDADDPRSPAALAWVGLALIALAVVGLDRSSSAPNWWASLELVRVPAVAIGLGDHPFPGWAVAIPVIGTALTILAGPRSWPNRTLLSNRLMVFVGLVSYPWYLWHWPLLSFAEITESAVPSGRLKLSIVVVSFALAVVTHVVIERPVKRLAQSRTAATMAALAALLIACGGVGFAGSRGAFGSRNPSFITAIEAGPTDGELNSGACRAHFHVDAEHCQIFDASLPVTTALLGDSHSGHFFRGVGTELAAKHETVVNLGQSGCPPLLGIRRVGFTGNDACDHVNDVIIGAIASDPAVRRVLLSFRGTTAVTGVGFGATESDRNLRAQFQSTGTGGVAGAAIREGLERTLQTLLERGKTGWVLLQVPELDFALTECAGRPFTLEHPAVRAHCGIARSRVLERQASYRQILEDVGKKLPAVRVFDPLTSLCDKEWCSATREGRLLYFDSNHLSTTGSLFFAGKFQFD